jgi:excisionase family DNA binding protein
MARRVTPNTPVVPSAASVEFASQLLRQMEADSARFVIQDRHTGTEMEIDETVFDLIRLLLTTVASNRAVSLMPYDHELTTHQAARFIVSRPYLVRLLDDNKIPHRMVGTHRRVRIVYLLHYKEATRVEIENAKDELAEISQKNDMGY